MDRATLWALVCIAEVQNVSGITDPYDLILPKLARVWEVVIMRGMTSLQQMFKDRRKEKEVQNDIFQGA